MREPVIIIWAILALISGFVFMWLAKAYKRKPGRYMTIHKLVLYLLTLGASFLVYYSLSKSLHLIWVSRLSVFTLAVLHTWALYIQPLSERNKFEYEEDSFWPEFVFTAIQAFAVSIVFVFSPQLFGLVEYSVDVSATLWDLPLSFLMPFLLLKLSDYASQMPNRLVENPWVFPIEPVVTESWPWRNLLQVNFQVRKSLLDEYKLFGAVANPWIESPKEVPLGDVFRLVIQERRKRADLETIQDLGDEYDGQAKFWWLFSIKQVWWNPYTWFRKPRYLDPNQSIMKNMVRKNDIILLRRISSEGIDLSGMVSSKRDGIDPEQTVIIK